MTAGSAPSSPVIPPKTIQPVALQEPVVELKNRKLD